MKNICNTRKNGLSPLARGARHSQADPATALRFIPAGAGNTPASSVYSARSPVYPRWRGEHYYLDVCRIEDRGLSPLARGTHKLSADLKSGTRFIPAGAGNTSKNLKSKPVKTVYPRWRGEHLFDLVDNPTDPGLSPLARGTHISVINRDFRLRFIPAGAGNTAFIYAGVSLLSVYPRWRGEHQLTTWEK